MPFPFFRLPMEIRNIVHEMMFLHPSKDRLITPNPTKEQRKFAKDKSLECFRQELLEIPDYEIIPVFRSGHRVQRDILEIPESLPFLRTCQQIHREASEILYGGNTFYFDDIASEGFITLTDCIKHCESCTETLGANFDYRCRGCDTTVKGHRCTYIGDIEQRSISTMTEWLISIGEANRLHLRLIHLYFTTPVFTDSTKIAISPTVVPIGYGAHLLDKALRLLSDNNNIRSIGLSFAVSPYVLDGTDRGRKNTIRALCNVSDIQGTIWKSIEDVGAAIQLKLTGRSGSLDVNVLGEEAKHDVESAFSRLAAAQTRTSLANKNLAMRESSVSYRSQAVDQVVNAASR